MEKLSDKEQNIIQYYKKFHIYHKNHSIDNYTKEQSWIKIYQKIPIDSSIHNLLFNIFDNQSVLDELDTLTQTL